ncbi:DNA repair protein RecN [Ligilactobacillus pobuzihii]|uniref:DNA repair protein RecN n=1 Tax=Ligilactobacillus pobuzihii TaxID=449659 RepID=A0A0R2LWU7_9LACO|nr:DNA repair protein RecN [Ligilactobacillus pobuzihii]KRK11511.1 dna repair protein [Ligilactobacillus pobuzihii E100301 = KCTC 13174]KRO02826.1 dna repair protein [Ligilactobacillus pobuzihii]GEN47221.1 DNA repair protein RecN [Ligilactobacillus pobuzihii]
MLSSLTIKDFAIIDKIQIDFQPKMTVLTGETGAGKSIVIDALGLLAGGRGSSDYIRKGKKKALLQALFILPEDARSYQILDEIGVSYDYSGLILQRELYRNGHNICRINGELVNLANMRRVGETLIDIHGQNEHQELMHPEKHLSLLDSFADKQIGSLKENYYQSYQRYRQEKDSLEKKEKHEKEWAQRLDMLQFQVQEIKTAQLQTDEEEQLTEEKYQLDNYQAIHDALENSYQLLSGEDIDALGQVGSVMEQIQRVSGLSSDLGQISQRVTDAYYGLADSVHEISNQLSTMEWDEDRLDQIEHRLEDIHQLKRKYGSSIPEILSYYQKIKAELKDMQKTGADSDEQKAYVEQLLRDSKQSAHKLSQQRKKAAVQLEKAVHKELKALYMGKAIFKVKFLDNSNDDLNAQGMDQIEFYIQTNPGESMGPLSRIASGGELSRIMLALKTIFAQRQGVTSIIFDEVDTGVSGRVAQAIAEKISLIAQNSQVLCITHLPQVAAVSDHHYLVEKKIQKGRTETSVKQLARFDKVEELARMLAGTEITDLAREHAAELLKLGHP